MALKRRIGTFSLTLVGVGSMIGSGWLFGPFFAAQLAGPAAVICWIIAGGMMAFLALTYAELASTFPLSGGTIHYIQLSHGPLVGFTMAWVSWVSALVVAPVETFALIHYAGSYIPGFFHRVHGENVISLLGFCVAASLMLILCVINAYGITKFTKVNNVITIIKFLVPLLTIIAIASVSFHANNFVALGFAPMGFKAILTALPSAGIVFSFLGYNNAVMLAGEVKNPQRSFPIAIIGALIICLVIYCLLQIVFIGALSSDAFHAGWQHLSFVGDVGPFAGIAMSIGLIWLAGFLYADAFISPYGTALVYTASTARLFYAMGANDYVTKYFMHLNRFGIPWRIIILNYLLGLFLFLPFPSWQRMVTFLVSAFVFSYAVGPLSLIILRKTLPNEPRLFRLPAAQVISFLAFYICNLIIYWAGWSVVSKMLIAILMGYIVLFISNRKKFNLSFELRKAWWLFLYVILTGTLSYLGAFGGRGVIPFGWDFLVMAAFSMGIYQLALHFHLSAEEAQRALLTRKDELKI